MSRSVRAWGMAAGAAAGIALGMSLAVATPASAGVAGPAFYVNGTTYRTVGTPTDLSHTRAPAHSWDVIYEFLGAQLNVAGAAPGDAGYNGGRWQGHGLSFPTGTTPRWATVIWTATGCSTRSPSCRPRWPSAAPWTKVLSNSSSAR